MSGLSKFFIDRPIFAAVISIVILLIGGLALPTLPTLPAGLLFKLTWQGSG